MYYFCADAMFGAIQELTKELKIRRGALGSRGSSYIPTPLASGSDTPQEGTTLAIQVIPIRENPAKRYADLFRECLRNNNSDCNFQYNSRACTLKYKEDVMWECPFQKKNVKSAYALLRLICGDNIITFLKYLKDNRDRVPDFDGETPLPTARSST
jgi:hypothetical protein